MKQNEPDFGRISSLLSIVKDVAGVAPGFSHITSAAMNELREINQKLNDIASANRGPPTNPLALQAAPEPERHGIPTNELGAEPDRTTFDDLKDPDAAIEQHRKDDEKQLKANQEREAERRRQAEAANRQVEAGQPALRNRTTPPNNDLEPTPEVERRV